jgi:hypothetical protein
MIIPERGDVNSFNIKLVHKSGRYPIKAKLSMPIYRNLMEMFADKGILDDGMDSRFGIFSDLYKDHRIFVRLGKEVDSQIPIPQPRSSNDTAVFDVSADLPITRRVEGYKPIEFESGKHKLAFPNNSKQALNIEPTESDGLVIGDIHEWLLLQGFPQAVVNVIASKSENLIRLYLRYEKNLTFAQYIFAFAKSREMLDADPTNYA